MLMIPISKIDLKRNARNLDKNLWPVPGLLFRTACYESRPGYEGDRVKLIGAVINKLIGWCGHS